MKKKIKIEVVLDFVCPWCFVGKENLKRSLEALSEQYDFEVTYLPFQLDPDVDRVGLNRLEYMQNKFGDVDKFAQAEARVQTMALAAGLHLNFDKVKLHINSFDCHRLVYFAHKYEKQTEIVDALFYYYFTEGMNISSIGNLAQIAKEFDLDEEEVLDFLESEEGVTPVNEKIAEVYSMGVTGVPFVVIDRILAVSGAQPPESFTAAILEAQQGG